MNLGLSMPSDLRRQPEKDAMALESVVSHLSGNPCYDAVLTPGGELIFVNPEGEICGGVSPEFLKHFGGNA